MSVSLQEYYGETLYAEYSANKSHLKQISFYSLPDKPSAKGYSAQDIKRKSYEPVLQLYDWLYKVKKDLKDLSDKIDDWSIRNIYSLTLNSESKTISAEVDGDFISAIVNFYNCEVSRQLVTTIQASTKTYIFADCNVAKDGDDYIVYGVGVNVDDEIVAHLAFKLSVSDSEISGNIDEPAVIASIVDDLSARLNVAEVEASMLDLTHTANLDSSGLNSLRNNGGVILVDDDEETVLVLGGVSTNSGENLIISPSSGDSLIIGG